MEIRGDWRSPKLGDFQKSVSTLIVVHGGAPWDAPTLGMLIVLPCLLVLLSSSLPHSKPPSFISLGLVSGQVLGVSLVPDSVRPQGGLLPFPRISGNPPRAPRFFLDLVSALLVCSSPAPPSHLRLLCNLQTRRASLPRLTRLSLQGFFS